MKAKKPVLVLALTIVFVLVVAATAIAAKPAIVFDTGLQSDFPIAGTLEDGFTIETNGVAGLEGIYLVTPQATPALQDGMYPFYLEATGPQKAELKDYFSAKGWSDEYLAQIKTEIAGGSPFFYLKAEDGEYSLVDGFAWELSGGLVAPTLRIDGNYPEGTYMYKGHLKADNCAALQLTISLTVEWAD